MFHIVFNIKMVRSLLILSTLALDRFEVNQIVYPFLNQTINKLYDVGTNHSYIIHTEHNISLELPLLLYRRPYYIILTHAPQLYSVNHEWQYKKDTVIWYNHKEEKVKLWSILNHVWYESCEYPYRKTKS